MKRIIVAVLVALALVGVPGRAALAQGRSETAPNCEKGNDIAYDSPGSEHRSTQAKDSLDKVYYGKCLEGEE